MRHIIQRFPVVRANLVILLVGSAWLMGTVSPRAQVQAQAQVEIPAHLRPMKPVPPPGIAIPESDRSELSAEVESLGAEIESLRRQSLEGPGRAALADVEVYWKAVHDALKYHEFYRTNELATARSLIVRGRERAAALRAGSVPWGSATGPVVRGYVSRIDGSTQPYGLLIPASYRPGGAMRLDIWMHGRGETLTELNFIAGCEKGASEFKPENAIVLLLYGRYCNANKFAGEIDLFEALEDVERRYAIDTNRIVVRGFSMGGAACWHFAAHHAGRWAAANPGAGFTDTATYLKIDPASNPPTWYERRLWHLYDPVDYAANLFHCPVIAYSGELDSQKLAADLMATAMRKESLELTHIIGPKTGHKYEPEARQTVIRKIDELAARGRNPVPGRVRFTTWTLRYNSMLWVTVDALGEHWRRARVDAEIGLPSTVTASTENVTALTFAMPPGLCPLEPQRPVQVILDGSRLNVPMVAGDGSWTVAFKKTGDGWINIPSRAASDPAPLRKRHGLQGPIDDAFMDRFVMVRPTGAPANARTAEWVASELAHATREWRAMFRGEAMIVDDTGVSAELVANCNLVLWGDPGSNKVLGEIASKLPVRWAAADLDVGGRRYPADHHVPVLIYPNPLNPKRYVVINSGVTFREADYVTNARQTPKLPDWAVIDVTTPPSIHAPGKVVDAGFFDERWQLGVAK